MLQFFVIHRNKFLKYSLTCIYKVSSAKFLLKYLFFLIISTIAPFFTFLICENWCRLAAIDEKSFKCNILLKENLAWIHRQSS